MQAPRPWRKGTGGRLLLKPYRSPVTHTGEEPLRVLGLAGGQAGQGLPLSLLPRSWEGTGGNDQEANMFTHSLAPSSSMDTKKGSVEGLLFQTCLLPVWLHTPSAFWV